MNKKSYTLTEAANRFFEVVESNVESKYNDKELEISNKLLDVLSEDVDPDNGGFTNAYIEAALWSSLDDNDEPLDKKYSKSDISDETMNQIKDDCNKFKDEATQIYSDGGWSDDQAGHDFWLTRNGHGAGFWDRSESEGYNQDAGKQLTDISKKFGEYDLYVGDDGLIYGN